MEEVSFTALPVVRRLISLHLPLFFKSESQKDERFHSKSLFISHFSTNFVTKGKM